MHISDTLHEFAHTHSFEQMTLEPSDCRSSWKDVGNKLNPCGNHKKQPSETEKDVAISFKGKERKLQKPNFVPASKIRGWTVMSGLVYHDVTATHTATHTATRTATHTVDWCIMT